VASAALIGMPAVSTFNSTEKVSSTAKLSLEGERKSKTPSPLTEEATVRDRVRIIKMRSSFFIVLFNFS